MADFIKQIYKRSLKTSYKKEGIYLRKTVFLDRDGVLINNVDYLSDPSQIHLLPEVVEGIKRLNAENAVLVVVTNQPVIARGLATIKDVQLINDTLVTMLNNKQAYINAIYSCPHHPERNHADIPQYAMKYRIECECRKPGTAMLKKAVEDYNISLKEAFIIGDSTRDIKAGESLGITTILVKKDHQEEYNNYPIRPDYVVSNFSKAVDIICKQ